MKLINWAGFIIFEIFVGCVVASPKPQSVKFTNVLWDGVAAYITVERPAVQEKLDAFHNRTINGQQAPKLYMPTKPIFSDILTTTQHVVYLDFGFLTALDFVNESSISSYGAESSIIIPFLSDSPDGVPKYALALGQLYQRDHGYMSVININFPYLAIDNITVTKTGAIWRNGSDELRASLVTSNPCKAPSHTRHEEFDAMIDQEMEFSFSQPDLGYCDHHQLVENPVCDILESIKADVEQAVPNVCQFYQGRLEGTCEASVAIVNITDGFRELLLLKDGPVNVVASEKYFGDYDIGLQYPCIVLIEGDGCALY